MLVFKESGKPEYPEKTSRSEGENQQQTQPTYAVALLSPLHHPYSFPPLHKDNYWTKAKIEILDNPHLEFRIPEL